MRSRFVPRIARLVLVATAFLTVGCFSMQTVGALQPTDRLPSDVRVYRYTGSIVDLATSRLAADTIYGITERGSGTEIKIPLAHVDSIVYRRFEPRRTAMFVVGTVVFFAWTMDYIKSNSPNRNEF